MKSALRALNPSGYLKLIMSLSGLLLTALHTATAVHPDWTATIVGGVASLLVFLAPNTKAAPPSGG